MSRRPSRAVTLFDAAVLVALVALIGGGVYGWTVLSDCHEARAAQADALERARVRIASQTAEHETLVAELEAALRIGERLSGQVDALEADLEEARATRLEVREVRGTADFPILRAMAREGESVAGFAEREQTTEAIVRALNPWLEDDAEALESWQTLWVPKPR